MSIYKTYTKPLKQLCNRLFASPRYQRLYRHRESQANAYYRVWLGVVGTASWQ